jgi:hypothetical protein
MLDVELYWPECFPFLVIKTVMLLLMGPEIVIFWVEMVAVSVASTR